METGANKDEGQSRRRHKEEARRSECETTTGKNKNGEKCGWWFVWERILYVDGAFSRVPTLFPCCSCCCCCFPFFFAPLSFVPFTLSSLGAICLPSVSPVMLQMAFVRDVGDHRGFLSIWPWHALLLSLAAWCSTCKSPSTLDPYCWCLADRGPRLSPGAPVVITASPCLEQAATFAFPLDCVSLLPFVEKNCNTGHDFFFPFFFKGVMVWISDHSWTTVDVIDTLVFLEETLHLLLLLLSLLFGSITTFPLSPFRRETHRAEENVIICLNNSSKGRN